MSNLIGTLINSLYMGVTYKLKPQIIDFILQQKQDNPKLSCRKLSEIVSEKFETKISKSSVNTILKDSELSNPVGRQPGTVIEKPEKIEFKIPEERKKNLFSVSLEEIEGHEPVPQENADESIAEEEEIILRPDPMAENVQTEEKPEEIPEPSPDLHQIKEPSTEYVHKKELQQYSDHTGAIFFKCMQWFLNIKGILSTIPGVSLSSEYAKAVLSLPAFGYTSIDQVPENSTFWKVNDVSSEDKEDLKKHEQLLNLETIQKILHYWHKQNLMCYQWELRLTHNKKYFWDPIQGLIQRQPSVETELPLPIAIALIVDEWINNMHPIVLRMDQGHSHLSEAFYDVMRACNNVKSNHFEHFSCATDKGEVLVEWPGLVHFHRNVICALWPWQKEYQQITVPQHFQRLSHEPLGLDVLIAEQTLVLSDPNYVEDIECRLVIIRDAYEQNKELILLNNMQDRFTCVDVAIHFLLRFKCVWDMIQTVPENRWQDTLRELKITPHFPHHISESLMDEKSSLTTAIHRVMTKTFFPDLAESDLETFMDQIYQQEGYFSSTDRAFYAYFQEKELENRPCLQDAINRINSLPIFNEKNQKIFLSTHRF